MSFGINGEKHVTPGASALLPGVTVVFLSDQNDGDEESFAELLETSSILRKDAKAVRAVTRGTLDEIDNEYVAFLRDGDSYVNDYALELLVNTAAHEEAEIVGGATGEASARLSDFVFSAAWLRENADLLEILRTGDFAFIAAALARAGKAIVNERIYTKRTGGCSEPLVSVVVPAYNSEGCLDRCLESLVRQTDCNLEIIIVDDGATDATGAIADKWAGRDKRVKALHKANGGLSSARNAGMAVARGKYIGFVDADDYVDAGMFGTMADALERHPQCDICKCGVEAEYTYKVAEAERIATREYFESPAEGEVVPGIDTINATDVCAVDKLYRLEFLRRNGIRFPEGVKNEDEAFFFQVFCRARNCYYLPQKFYRYERGETGIMANQVKDADAGRLPDALLVYSFIAKLLESENRRDLLGVLYRHMIGFLQRFKGSAIKDAATAWGADILRETKAFYYADLVCGKNRTWTLRRIFEVMNKRGETPSKGKVRQDWFPSTPPGGADGQKRQPIVSFIVPVFNVEKYIAATLESLRCQTLQDFEVICIDDGSSDDSGKILDFYAGIDPRIKVVHAENGGVSRARNLGMSKAAGKYVAFVDGDDRLDRTMAAKTVFVAARHRLDAAMFDYRCFAYDTFTEQEHFWQLARQAKSFPQGRTFAPGGLQELPVYGACWMFLFSREFLARSAVPFPEIKLGEDLVWVLSTLSRVKRMRILDEPLYAYRRGNPSSAVSRLQTKTSDAPTLALKGLADVVSDVASPRLKNALLKRISSDVLFYGELFPNARAWLQSEGFERFGGVESLKRICQAKAAKFDSLASAAAAPKIDIEYFIRQTPKKIQRIMRDAVKNREGVKKDLIIVAGQLDSTTNEAIDSWTFFRWLQENNVPSRYVAWRKHSMVEKMRRENGLRDVILLNGNGVDNYEFIEKCRGLLPRLRAVVMENVALNPLTWRYFHLLEGCHYIFLQHGVTFWKMAPYHASAFAVANYVNVASEIEKNMLEEYVPAHSELGSRPKYLIAGLPRWDLLKDESSQEKEKVVFFMPTWRAAFNSGMERIATSAYLAGIRAFVTEENIERLKKRNVRIVMAAHHHLVNRVKDLDFKIPVKLAPPNEVSYWIRHASLCITDFSSVSFDFLFLDKPCIYWTPDRHDGLLSGEDYSEVIFAERQGAKLFNRVTTVEEVMAMIEKYADAGFKLEPEKKAISGKFFAHRKNICRQLFKQIRAIDRKEAEA